MLMRWPSGHSLGTAESDRAERQGGGVGAGLGVEVGAGAASCELWGWAGRGLPALPAWVLALG